MTKCLDASLVLQQMLQEPGSDLVLVIGLNLRLIWDWELAERAFSLTEELDQPTVLLRKFRQVRCCRARPSSAPGCPPGDRQANHGLEVLVKNFYTE